MRFFLILITNVLASICYSQVKIGVSSGINVSNLYSDELLDSNKSIYQPSIRFRIGVTVEMQLNNRIGISGELNYSEGGAKIRTNEQSVKVQYLSLPISFYYSPIKNLRIYGGPEINFKLGSNNDGRYTWALYEFKTIDYGAQIGLELLVIQRFGIGIKNYFGFQYNSEVTGYMFNSKGDPVIGDIGINRNNIFGIYLIYLIKS